MSSKIITISREFGSGGRTIGKETAQKLGIPCYDYEIIEKIARETGFDAEYIKEQGEYASHRSRFVNAFAARDTKGMSMQDHLWQKQQQIILELARKEPCCRCLSTRTWHSAQSASSRCMASARKRRKSV